MDWLINTSGTCHIPGLRSSWIWYYEKKTTRPIWW